MNKLPKVLICDDDSIFQIAVKHSLKGKYELRSAFDGDEALTIIKSNPIDVLLLDIQMRSPNEGLDYVPKIKELDSDVAIIISSGLSDFATVKEAMRLGAADYVLKDFDPDDLRHTIETVLERRILLQRNRQQNFETLNSQKKHILIGESPAIRILKKTIDKIRSSRENVLITGETGSGKEIVARLLRPTLTDGTLAPFIAVDSSTIQSSTAESILFGHERGAFTGAERTVKGIFEESNGGVIYFDEVANMPLDIQAKLLRVIQEKEITRLGSSRIIPLDFKVVCATNRKLEDMINKGEFKEDLYQRLNVLPIEIPPLRDRKEDIPLLIEYFMKKNTSDPAYARGFTPAAIEVLTHYPWPGNVRELKNVLAFTLTMSDADEIDVADLPPKVRDLANQSARVKFARTANVDRGNSFYDQIACVEKRIISEGLEKMDGNISRLAVYLGMDRSHLYTKLKEHKLKESSYRKTDG